MHVVITGASSGIGEAIAKAYLRGEARVSLVARRRSLLEKIASEHAKERVHVVDRDLSDPEAACAAIDDAVAALGPVDVLVNNAGIQIVKGFVDTPWEELERMLRLDLHTPLRLAHRVLPSMIARKTGTIVDIASMAAIAPTPGMCTYNAAKAGLAAASESLRSEARKHGVHVVTVYPGPVTSALEAAGRAAYEDGAATRYVPTGSPDVLARLVVDAVAKRKPRVIYPAVYRVARHFPNTTRWALDTMTPPLKTS